MTVIKGNISDWIHKTGAKSESRLDDHKTQKVGLLSTGFLKVSHFRTPGTMQYANVNQIKNLDLRLAVLYRLHVPSVCPVVERCVNDMSVKLRVM
jgi:hypothetical protein